MANGENTNVLIIGSNRSGKSITSIKLGNDVNCGHFSIRNNVKWDWLSLVTAYEKTKRSALALEEIGVVYDRMNYYTDTNKYFKYLMETQAYLLNCLIMNVPDLYFIPKNLWSLLNYIVVTKRNGQYVNAEIYRVTPDRLKGKIRFNKISNWSPDISNISPELLDEYELIKDEWNKKNLQDWIKATRPPEQKQELKPNLEMQQLDMRINESRNRLKAMGIKL
jgi:hypothetical protein